MKEMVTGMQNAEGMVANSQRTPEMVSIIIAINLYGKYRDNDPTGKYGTQYSIDAYSGGETATSHLWYQNQNPMSDTFMPSYAPSKAPTTGQNRRGW